MTTQSDSRAEPVALNADVVGYSRLLADDFDTTTKAMETLKGVVSDEVAASNGTLTSFVGDNFMAVFTEATDAMRAAIAITTRVEEHNTGLPPGKRVRFRMGLDSGPITETGGQWFGDALNVAARIQAIAPEGGISVSGNVYRYLDEPALRFAAVGRRNLKNIPEEVDVYEFADFPTDKSPGHVTHTLALEAPTVAVLPFHVETDDETVASAAAIIRSDLVHRLTQIPQLEVVDTSTDGAAPARYMIESGVHHLGDQLRVYSRVLDVSRMTAVKGHRWIIGVDAVLETSDQIADEVARSIEVDLIIGAPASLYAELQDPEAIERIYLGWYHLTAATPEDWALALDLFGQVAVSHPDQPYGHTLSAYANLVGADLGWAADPEAALALASEQAQWGDRRGDPTGVSHAIRAAILLVQGRAAEAKEVMDDVAITRPTCDVTYGLEGSVLRYLGDWRKSIESMDVAMRLTGMNKPWYPTVKACALYHGGLFEDAAATASTVLEYQPNNLEALLVLAASQKELGLERRARATADKVRDRFPGLDVEEWVDRNPYQREEMVRRWKDDLASVGLMGLTHQ